VNAVFDLDRIRIELRCPQCGFYEPVTLKQVRLGDVVICRGCKASISLIDHMHEIANARQRLQAALRSFRELAGNPLKITLRL